jgi:hypothetical protein
MIKVSFEDGTEMDTAALNMREQIDFNKIHAAGRLRHADGHNHGSRPASRSMITLQGQTLNELQTLAEDSISPPGTLGRRFIGHRLRRIRVWRSRSIQRHPPWPVTSFPSPISPNLSANNIMIPRAPLTAKSLSDRPNQRGFTSVKTWQTP